jgi:hypothetical protein
MVRGFVYMRKLASNTLHLNYLQLSATKPAMLLTEGIAYYLWHCIMMLQVKSQVLLIAEVLA